MQKKFVVTNVLDSYKREYERDGEKKQLTILPLIVTDGFNTLMVELVGSQAMRFVNGGDMMKLAGGEALITLGCEVNKWTDREGNVRYSNNISVLNIQI